jgi:hypothetical protein
MELSRKNEETHACYDGKAFQNKVVAHLWLTAHQYRRLLSMPMDEKRATRVLVSTLLLADANERRMIRLQSQI